MARWRCGVARALGLRLSWARRPNGFAANCKQPPLTALPRAASARSRDFISLDIVAIGDAIVDVIATCDDSFLARRTAAKGSMQLLTPDEADALYAAMGPAREISGGSAANSMAGVAALGGSTPASSARSLTTSSARSSRMTCERSASGSKRRR